MPQFLNYDPDKNLLTCLDKWDLHYVTDIEKQLSNIKFSKKSELQINGAQISKMDSAGALLLTQLHNHDLKIHFEGFSTEYEKLIALVEEQHVEKVKLPPSENYGVFANIGRMAYRQFLEFQGYLSFVGMLALEVMRLAFQPWRWRLNSLINVMDHTGLRALPIIALLSFMIGIVLAYQMGNQLRAYGANVFIVDLLGLSVLREFGPLLTAIMVAGRTGSAFTAQLGIMKINQEVDALTTMGVTPAELLLLPRIFGLVIALPLLTMWANMFGIIGGMTMASSLLDVSAHDFLTRFQQEIPLRALLIGLGKAPIFALIISSVGCYQGMQVRGSADSVGENTTRSVVLGIFFIIVADALFSIIFSKLKL